MNIPTTPRASITFSVAAVERATEPRTEVAYEVALKELLAKQAGPLEAYSRNTKPLVSPRPNPIDGPVHPFIYALNLAYDRHHPLILSPDMIWLLIAQGFARHINLQAEALRHRFVRHSGKVSLVVVRDAFIRGFAGNDWEGVFTEFTTQIKGHVGAGVHGLVMRDFSTTGIVEKAAFEITLMDAMQSYFTYILQTRCGIPEITLEGTPEDWEAVRTGAVALADYDLDWWISGLLPVLDRFVAASRGDIDQLFWSEFYKVNHGSGGPFVSGYVLNLFPYLFSSRKPNEQPYRSSYLGWREPGTPDGTDKYSHSGITTASFPSPFSVAPFIWMYYRKRYEMKFIAGFIGVAQEAETLALRPEIGWAVCDK